MADIRNVRGGLVCPTHNKMCVDNGVDLGGTTGCDYPVVGTIRDPRCSETERTGWRLVNGGKYCYGCLAYGETRRECVSRCDDEAKCNR